MTNEQWKTDGDCSKCRRRTYCSHMCRAAEKDMRNYAKNLIINKVLKRMRVGDQNG